MRESTTQERKRFLEKVIALCELSVVAYGPIAPQQELLDIYRMELLELNTKLKRGRQP